MYHGREAEVLEMSDDLSVKIKEFGRPIFKSKGKNKQVKDEVDDFWKVKGL
jgi:hypothetical protein